MGESRYEYDNFKVDPPRVDDGWYLVKDGMTYRVDVPIDKMRFTKSINILTGEVYYPSNADRIRAMSVEELAEVFTDVGVRTLRLHRLPVAEPVIEQAKEDWLVWLKQEADK